MHVQWHKWWRLNIKKLKEKKLWYKKRKNNLKGEKIKRN